MSIICRSIKENKQSPFYSFVCNDVCFDRLKYYKNKTGNPKMKKKYENHFSKTAIGTRLIGNNPPKLPLPKKVKNDFDKFDISKYPGWVLGYNNIESLNFLYLFPSKQNRGHPSKVCIADLPKANGDITDYQMMNYDFIANKIFIWPKTVILRDDISVPDASVFSIDRLFLDPIDGDIESISIFFDEKELPSRLYFDIFYDTECNFLYFKNKYEVNLGIDNPPCIHFPPGCKWTKDEKLRHRTGKKRNLFETARRYSLRNWISS